MHSYFGKKHIAILWEIASVEQGIGKNPNTNETAPTITPFQPASAEALRENAIDRGLWWPEPKEKNLNTILNGLVIWVPVNEVMDTRKIAYARVLQQAQIAKIEAEMHIFETSKRFGELAEKLKWKFIAVLWKDKDSDKVKLSPEELQKKEKEIETRARDLTNEYLIANKEQYIAYKKEISHLPEEEQKAKMIAYRKNIFETFCREKGLEIPAVEDSVWEEGAESQVIATSNMTFDSSDDTFDAMDKYVQSTESYKNQHFAEAEATNALKEEFPGRENELEALKQYTVSTEGSKVEFISDYLPEWDDGISYFTESKIDILAGEEFIKIDAAGSRDDWIIYSSDPVVRQNAIRLYASFSKPPLDIFRRDGYAYMSAVETRVAKEVSLRLPWKSPSPEDIARVMQFILLKQNPVFQRELDGITLESLIGSGTGIATLTTFLKNHWDNTSSSILTSAQSQGLVTDDNNLRVVNFMKALSDLA